MCFRAERLRADIMCNMGFREGGAGCGTCGAGVLDRLAIIFDCVADGGGDFVAGGIREADVQDAVSVAAGQVDGSVDSSQDIGLEQIEAAQDASLAPYRSSRSPC